MGAPSSGGSGGGLASLVGAGSGEVAQRLHSQLAYIFSLTPDAADQAVQGDAIDYPALGRLLLQQVDALRSGSGGGGQQASSSSGSWPEQQPGRLGPAHVEIDQTSMCGLFGLNIGSRALTLEALGNFSSCRANVAVFAGKWMYEATVLTSGIQQVRARRGRWAVLMSMRGGAPGALQQRAP